MSSTAEQSSTASELCIWTVDEEGGVHFYHRSDCVRANCEVLEEYEATRIREIEHRESFQDPQS